MTLIEVFTRDFPYNEMGELVGWKQAVTALMEQTRKPMIASFVPNNMKKIIKMLIFNWEKQGPANKGNEDQRIESFDQAVDLLLQAAKTQQSYSSGGIIDCLVSDMEHYVRLMTEQVRSRVFSKPRRVSFP